MATHSSTLAWKIPWTEESGGLLCPSCCKEVDTTEQLHFHFQSQSEVILEPKKIKSVTVSTFSPSVCHEGRELGAMILVF